MFFKRHPRILESAVFLLGWALTFRYWLFVNVLRDPSRWMSSGGTHQQNLSVYFYNAREYFRGVVYPAGLDQYTWYADMLGANEASPLPSFFFGVLYRLSGNYILAYNGLVFGNLALLLLGLYWLQRYYGVGRLWAALSPGLLVTSYGWQILYDAYVHAFYFAGLPWALLAVEKILFGERGSRRVWFGVYTLAAASLFWASWHLLLFSSVILLLFASWSWSRFWPRRGRLWPRVLGLVGVSALLTLPLIPLGLKSLRVGQILNSTRTLATVAGESWPALEIGYAHWPYKLFNKLAAQLAPERILGAGSVHDLAPLDVHTYPSFLGVLLFWGVFTWMLWVVLRRVLSWCGRPLSRPHADRYTVTLGYAAMYLVLCIFAFGPFLRDFPVRSETFLPYGYLYLFYYPARAVRAAWRFAGVSLVVGVPLAGLLLDTGYGWIMKVSFLRSKRWRVAFQGVVAAALVGMFVFNNHGWRDEVVGRASFDPEVVRVLDAEPAESFDFFVWSHSKVFFQDQRELSTLVGRYNFDRGGDRLRWVLGGGAGTYERSTLLLSRLRQNPENYAQLVDVLIAKEVEYVLADNLSTERDGVEAALEAGYDLQYTSPSQSVWRLRPEAEAGRAFESVPEYTLQGSRYLTAKSGPSVLINQQNPGLNPYLQMDTVTLHPYELRLVRGAEILFAEEVLLARPLYLPPGQGRTLTRTVSLPEIEAGPAVWELSTEGELLASKSVEIVPESKLRELAAEEVEVEFPLRLLPAARADSAQTVLATTLDVRRGHLLLQETEIPAWSAPRLDVAFYTREGDEYTGFPAWLTQPDCNLPLELYAGDTVTVWCEWDLPYDEQFLFYRTGLRTVDTTP